MSDAKTRRDAYLICTAAFARSSAVGFTGVVLAIYLARTGLSAAALGAVLGAGLMGSAAGTVLMAVGSDTFGRRRTLVALAVFAAAGYVGLTLAVPIGVLTLLAFAGAINGMGRDRGAATALEQAMLPQIAGDDRRTWIMAWYNVVLDAGHACGALASAAPAGLERLLRIGSIDAHRMAFLACAGALAATVVPYLALSSRVESPSALGLPEPAARRSTRTRRFVSRLAWLFGLDSLGSGFLSSALIAYWFFLRYGTSETELAALFFAARLLNAASHVVAAWMARRVGLVNTMVLTHLPSSLFLIAAPLSSSAPIAAGLFLCREALVEMDVPTRQSYVMAIVPPRDRTFASGVTNVTRNVGWAVGPSIAGFIMQQALAAPLFIGAGLKIAYDLLLYASFRDVRAPEEERRGSATPDFTAV